MNAPGKMSPADGAITLFNPAAESCNPTSCSNPFLTQVWMIGDETTAFSMAGNRLYTFHCAGAGSVDLDTHRLEAVIGYRDHFAEELLSVNGTPTPRSLLFGARSWPRAPEKGPTIAGDKIIIVYAGIVAVMEGQI